MWKSLVQRAFNRGGKAYDVSMVPFARGLHNRVVQDVTELGLPPGTPVLDAGAGTGRLAIELARLGLAVTGLDLSPSMVEQARRNAENVGMAGEITFEVGDVGALPYGEAAFELVVSTAALHHWTDPGAAAAELYRVVRPAGRLWVYDARLFRHTAFRAALRAVSGVPAQRDVLPLRRMPVVARLSVGSRTGVA
jgi:ubiquinone/menaquinone biosynthesis C-methylase UbiE